MRRNDIELAVDMKTKKTYNKKFSLYPLSLRDAVSALLKIKPVPLKKRRK
jgi:hypothetical protein